MVEVLSWAEPITRSRSPVTAPLTLPILRLAIVLGLASWARAFTLELKLLRVRSISARIWSGSLLVVIGSPLGSG